MGFFVHSFDEEQTCKHHTDFDGNDQVKEDCQHESRQKYDNVTFWSGFEQITERSPLAHIVGNNKKDRGDRRHRDHSGIRHQNDKHDDKCDRVDHSGDRCMSAVFDIGSSSCDCSCCRDSTKERRSDISGTLCNELHIGTMFAAYHTICNYAGKQ